MQPEGMYAVWTDSEGRERKDWTYLMGRDTRWSVKSPIIIAEWGIDGILYNRHPDPTYGNSGWRNFKEEWPPSRYADEYVECIRQAHPNVIGICPFISDFSDRKWQSFDLLDAYGELLARKDLCVKADAPVPPIDTHIPFVSGPAPPVDTGTPAQPPTLNVPPTPQPIAPGIIEPRVAQAILQIESGGRSFGDDGRILIRFEAHIFRTHLGNDALWSNHFRTDAQRAWVDQMWRGGQGDPWKQIHTGLQADEYAAFEFAQGLVLEAAHKAISMGAPQIMGFNHARIGYPSASAMYRAFADANVQTIGFINFFLSDPTLAEAMHRRDWRTIATRYNGAGNVDAYSKLLQAAYERLTAHEPVNHF